MMAKPSFEPTPRPPLTTTFASASEMPPGRAATCSGDADDEIGLGELGREGLDCPGASRLHCGDRVRRDGEQRPARMQIAPPRAGCRPSGCASRRSGRRAWPRCSSPRTAGRAGGDVREHLVAALGARRRRPRARPRRDERDHDRAHASGAKASSASCSATWTTVAPQAPRRPRRRRPTEERVHRPAAGQRRASASACSETVGRLRHVLDEDQGTCHRPPDLRAAPRRRRAPRRRHGLAEDLGLLALALGHDQPQLLEPRLGPRRATRRDRLASGAHAPRHGRIARQVEALEHGDDGRQRHDVDVAAALHLLLAAHAPSLDRRRP